MPEARYMVITNEIHYLDSFEEAMSTVARYLRPDAPATDIARNKVTLARYTVLRGDEKPVPRAHRKITFREHGQFRRIMRKKRAARINRVAQQQ